MNQRLPRIMLAAPASGSGKTTITCGLLHALNERGISCSAWKCGPDYIDPIFHKTALKIEGGNLDSFFLEEQDIRNLLGRSCTQGSMAVMEGVMGYYDGVAGISTQASSYDIARITETPVILVVDCKGASLSIAAMIQGFLTYRADHNIRSVLLNRCSKVMAERLTPVIEELGVSVAGWLPECKEMKLESRHLGLVLPEEHGAVKDQIAAVAKRLSETVNFDLLMEIGKAAPDFEWETRPDRMPAEKVRIGIAAGNAFRFYYQENLQLMRDFGAELVEFDPLTDSGLPDGVQGILLGGGYPELYASELSANVAMRETIRRAADSGMPYLAECGGFLYLHDLLEDDKGHFWPMAGVKRGRAYRTDRLSRFGYVTLESNQEKTLLKHPIKGHEFHYWDSEDCGSSWTARKPNSDRSWNCMQEYVGQIAGFPHLYYPSNRDFIRSWLDACRYFGVSEKGII